MDIPTPLEEALRDSITSGTFIDTKFWVFSKRSSKSGRVGGPKALFVNGRVLKSVPQLNASLGQRERNLNLRTHFPTGRKPYTTDYDYDADSDLEEEEDCDFSNDEETTRAVSEKPRGKSCNGYSDITSDSDSLFSGSTKAEVRGATTATPAHVGAVLIIDDVAFVTFQALLRYLYTNEIEFAPWGSAERRKARAREETTEPYEPPKPSPKSIYRLADKYDIPELKELALRQIKRDICKCDIVEEVFSKFTSRYSELRELELEQLARTLLSADPNSALNAFKEKIKACALGQLPHAKDVPPALYGLMGGNKPFDPTQPPAPAEETAIGRGWEKLKDALTLSLTSGSFLDSQFYALDSKPLASDMPMIRPIYFCSMAGGHFSSRLMKYSSRIWPSGKAHFQCVDDYDSEVEDKGSGTGIPIDAYPRSTCIPEDPLQTYKAPAPALVLKSGTARTWSAIFFYIYTSSIEFAPLNSRGVEGTHGEGAANGSPSKKEITWACSPKSIYALASRIDITSLRDLAYDNIKSQLDEKNIVQEFLSPFTADHEPIRRMQQKLLFSNLKSSAEGASFLETIRDSSSGEYPHRAAAMEHIFERMINDSRERVLAQAKETSQQGGPAAVQSSWPPQKQQGLQKTPSLQPLFNFSRPTAQSGTKPLLAPSIFPSTSKLTTPPPPSDPVSLFAPSSSVPTKSQPPAQMPDFFTRPEQRKK